MVNQILSIFLFFLLYDGFSETHICILIENPEKTVTQTLVFIFLYVTLAVTERLLPCNISKSPKYSPFPSIPLDYWL
jgi:hypothetical protein